MEGVAVAPGAVKMEGNTERPTLNAQRSTSNVEATVANEAAPPAAPVVPATAAATPVAAAATPVAPVAAEQQGGVKKAKPKVAVLVSPEEAARLKAANKVPEGAAGKVAETVNNPG